MSRNYAKSKGRGTKSPPFAMLPHHIIDSPNYIKLTYKAKSLLVDIVRDYNRRNNGDLAVTFLMMQSRGWKSDETLSDAREELIHFGFLKKARQGGRNQCNLYALTFFPVDDCGGKHDLQPSPVATNEWKSDQCEAYTPARQRRKLAKSVPRQSGNGTPTIGAVDTEKITYLTRQSG
ncbi:MAG: hypothetical protein CMK32_07140 [Porticoccaceae bacterium]|nr:hypothetical protein [Porticoccaceae bacterium]